LPLGEFFGEQGPDRFGWFPALRFRGGEQFEGGVAHVWEPKLTE